MQDFRKFSLYIFFLLLFGNNTFAEVIDMNKCYGKKDKVKNYNSWDDWNNQVWFKKEWDEDGGYSKKKFSELEPFYEGPRYEDYIISIKTEQGLVTELRVYHDEYLQAEEDYSDEMNKAFPSRCQDKPCEKFIGPKYFETNYDIVNYTSSIVRAEQISKLSSTRIKKYTIDINLNKKEAFFTWENIGDEKYGKDGSGTMICNGSSKAKNGSENNFKEYWWIVVLIMLISFFAYTQTVKTTGRKRKK